MEDKKINKTVFIVLAVVVIIAIVGTAIALALSTNKKQISKNKTKDITKYSSEDELKGATELYNLNKSLYNGEEKLYNSKKDEPLYKGNSTELYKSEKDNAPKIDENAPRINDDAPVLVKNGNKKVNTKVNTKTNTKVNKKQNSTKDPNRPKVELPEPTYPLEGEPEDENGYVKYGHELDERKEDEARNIVENLETEFKGINNQLKSKEVENDLHVGDYIRYKVPYTDMRTGYKFTQDNGWRVLNPGSKSSDGKYYGVEIISTGTPLMFNFNTYNTNGMIKPPVRLLMYNDLETIYVKGLSNPKVINYESHNFIIATVLSNYFHTLNWEPSIVKTFNNEKNIEKYMGDETTEYAFNYYNKLLYRNIGGNTDRCNYLSLVPNEYRNEALMILNLGLSDINVARNYSNKNYDGKGISISEYQKLLTPVSKVDAAEGLFDLRKLNKYGYNDNTITSIYLAEPSQNNNYEILTVDSTGRIIKSDGGVRGIRPVIAFNGIQLEKVNN